MSFVILDPQSRSASASVVVARREIKRMRTPKMVGMGRNYNADVSDRETTMCESQLLQACANVVELDLKGDATAPSA